MTFYNPFSKVMLSDAMRFWSRFVLVMVAGLSVVFAFACYVFS